MTGLFATSDPRVSPFPVPRDEVDLLFGERSDHSEITALLEYNATKVLNF